MLPMSAGTQTGTARPRLGRHKEQAKTEMAATSLRVRWVQSSGHAQSSPAITSEDNIEQTESFTKLY